MQPFNHFHDFMILDVHSQLAIYYVFKVLTHTSGVAKVRHTGAQALPT